MSRHNVAYKPGGAIGKTLDLTLKMQRVARTPEVVAQASSCTPSPTGLFWQNAAQTAFDQTVVIGSVEKVMWNSYPYDDVRIPHHNDDYTPFIHAARVEGDLCGKEKDVILAYTWVSSLTGDGAFPPLIWTFGNILTVTSPHSEYGNPITCDPGILTVTASLDGSVIGDPITLVLSIIGPYG